MKFKFNLKLQVEISFKKNWPLKKNVNPVRKSESQKRGARDALKIKKITFSPMRRRQLLFLTRILETQGQKV